MLYRTLSYPLALALSAGLASPGLAHEFSLLLLAPAAASQTEMDDMQAAFLIASAERDSHANETSEGHLGGLDVQMTLARIGEVAAGEAADVVVAPFAPADDAQVAALAAPGDAVIVDAGVLAGITPEERSDLAPFAERFQAATGRAADPAALGVYQAARVVDLAVRSVDSVADRAGLRQALRP
ncbi:MAG: hypothetical protein V4753_11980 [Pseudomonadota bacterium]